MANHLSLLETNEFSQVALIAAGYIQVRAAIETEDAGEWREKKEENNRND